RRGRAGLDDVGHAPARPPDRPHGEDGRPDSVRLGAAPAQEAGERSLGLGPCRPPVEVRVGRHRHQSSGVLTYSSSSGGFGGGGPGGGHSTSGNARVSTGASWSWILRRKLAVSPLVSRRSGQYFPEPHPRVMPAAAMALMSFSAQWPSSSRKALGPVGNPSVRRNIAATCARVMGSSGHTAVFAGGLQPLSIPA